MLRSKSRVEAVTPALAFNGLRLYQAISNEAASSIVRTETKKMFSNMAKNEDAIAPVSTMRGWPVLADPDATRSRRMAD
jgi:hypothetical protein